MSAPVPPEVERRLVELEIKASLAEDLVERLDAVVVRQQEQIDRLGREVARLARELAARDAGDPTADGPRDERPPHW